MVPSAAALVLVALALVSCDAEAARPAAVALGEVRLKGAATLYYLGGPGDPVVEVRVFLENDGEATESTSIHWDAEFGREFLFLDSEPKPWRVTQDGTGRGSVDTSGVLPRQAGTYRLWFAAATYRVLEPRLRVMSDGDRLLGENVRAEASHVRWQRMTPQQQTFEHGPLAGIAAAGAVLPGDSRSSFRWALAISLALMGVLLGGGIAAFVSIYRQQVPRFLGLASSETLAQKGTALG
ncbi:MAG: hypothetical protein AVDCRST_MAG77-2479 [uncultured Chloroflexi bacterium]|uniref:Intracellular proteinase inhibitor BsuPI domain-containing protein n=1 Tax=uncultured Chloroflexota bacterium TaxID=166587 RepID=A0A6J4IR58_9CHLR|nr:MAG: hypothetical protein AVDCRST_MAG77-2479 [uncultured Chloroflexota bacterium]